jgi:hypothetical protein
MLKIYRTSEIMENYNFRKLFLNKKYAIKAVMQEMKRIGYSPDRSIDINDKKLSVIYFFNSIANPKYYLWEFVPLNLGKIFRSINNGR